MRLRRKLTQDAHAATYTCGYVCVLVLSSATASCVHARLGHVLTNSIQPRAILALTATAPPATRASIHSLLGIPEANQVLESPLRDNLRLRVVHVVPGANKSGAVASHVVQLLKTGATVGLRQSLGSSCSCTRALPRLSSTAGGHAGCCSMANQRHCLHKCCIDWRAGELSDVKSAIVYAGFKHSCDSLALQLGRAGIRAYAYHAGLHMKQRELVQVRQAAASWVCAWVSQHTGVERIHSFATCSTVLSLSAHAAVRLSMYSVCPHQHQH